MHRPMPIRRYGARVLLQLLLPDIAYSHAYPHSYAHAYAYTNSNTNAYPYAYPTSFMSLRHLVHRRPGVHPIRRHMRVLMPVRMLLPDAAPADTDAATAYAHSYPHSTSYPHLHSYPDSQANSCYGIG